MVSILTSLYMLQKKYMHFQVLYFLLSVSLACCLLSNLFLREFCFTDLVPSEAPINLTAHNWTSLYSLPVTWEPVPEQYTHGILTNYYLSYFMVKQGDKGVLKTTVFEKILPASQTWFNITGLLPLSVYKIEIAASTSKGTGPISITFGGNHEIHSYIFLKSIVIAPGWHR